MSIKYTIKDPAKLRQRLAREKGWQTNGDIAAGAGLTYQYISLMFRQQPVGHRAITKLADAVGVGIFEIAEFAKEKKANERTV